MIQTTEVSITYKGDGVQTSFPYPYPYRNSDDIVGYIINDVGYEKRITNNFKYDKVSNIYQYPLAGDPLAAPYSIKLIRETPQQQNADLPGKLPFSLIEKSLDWIIMILQEIGSRCNSLWHIRNDCKLSETNARNSASAAAESEEKAANSEDMAKKWAMSPVSPDGVVDINSPTGYTQSAKIWAALSKEYAGLSKFKLPIGYYKSVAEMKASETAIVGRPCATLGYYAPNDGGGAVYIIRSKTDSDTDDGGSILILDNGNIAELFVDGVVNVKQFGAHGDGTIDDTSAFTSMLKYDNCYIPLGNYVITFPIVGKKGQHIVDLGTYTNITPCYPQNHRMIPNWEHAKFRKWAKSRVIPTNYYLNGVCYNDKTKKWVISTCTSDSTKQKIMVLNNSTYSVEAVYDYTTLNHANTLAYCPDTNIIYIPLNDSNKTIARIDASTYAELPSIAINERLFEMYYDRIAKVFVGTFTPGSDAVTRVYVYDANFTLLNTFDVDMGTYHELNGGCAHDGHLVFCTTSGDVYETDFFGNVLNKLESPRSGIELEDADYCVDTGHMHYFAKCPNWETTYNAFAVVECSRDDVFMTNSVMLLKNRYLIGETFDVIDGISAIGGCVKSFV